MTRLGFLTGAGERGATLACLLAATLCAGAILAEPPAAADPNATSALPRLPEPLRAEGGAFMQAPPFDAARQPLAGLGRLVPETVMSDAPPPEPPLRLAGILAEGATRRVLFSGLDGWLEEGGNAWGWTVDRIEARQVTVHRGAERRVLTSSDALAP